jgi:subtilisin family serine protease
MKKKLFTLILLVMLGAFLLQAATDDGIVKKSYANFENLKQIASSDGSVKVIVKLNVPGIKELTASSTRFCTVTPGKEKVWGGDLADMELAQAINRVTDQIVYSLGSVEYEVNHTYSSIPYVALRVSEEALTILESLSEVLGIEEDKPAKLPLPEPGGKEQLTKDGSASGGPDKPGLDVSTGIVGADAAWGMGYTGSGWYVAVLDTGIRKTHEFFTGKTVVEACYALGEDGIAGVGDCPNGTNVMTGAGSAVHHANTYQGYDHGTHVSGIATGNYGSLFGVAKDADIIAVQVFSKFSVSSGYCGATPCVLTWNSDQLAGLDYVYSIRGSYSIASANMSLGGGSYYTWCDSDSRKTAIDNLREVGIATAIATGNDGSCSFVNAPGCISSCVAVGSSTDVDAESGFNNWSATMQRLFAPGSSINSSTGASDTSYASWNGTSMATPHVAGAWAVLKQACPTAGVSDILTALRSKGVGITSVCDGYTAPVPRIQIDKAIEQEINVKRKSKSFLNGSTVNAGTYPLNKIVGTEFTFTIYNLGISNLLLTGSPEVTLSGTDAKYWKVLQQPTTDTISAFSSTDFVIRTAKTTVPVVPDGWSKTLSFNINIPNNDPNEGSYSFTIKVTVTN